MLKTLNVKNFTVFSDVTLAFSPGLNVIVGENGTGKTHLLKLGYLFCKAWPDLTAKRLAVTQERAQVYLAERLAGLFQVPDLSALIRSGVKTSATLHADVNARIPTVQIRVAGEPPLPSPGFPEAMPWHVQLQSSKDESGVLKANVVPDVVPDAAARNAFLPQQVFVPSKEMVSLFKGLIGLFDKYRDFPLDETYRDLALAMSTLELQSAPLLEADMLVKLRRLLGGDLKREGDGLLFQRADGSHLDVVLMAEGHRKLALLIYLISHGVLERGSTLFWDEPEANLNPAALRMLAGGLHLLAQQGLQVVVATHSYFLMKELDLLARTQPVPQRYFGLDKTENGVALKQADKLLGLDRIVALDEELAQYDRDLQGVSHA